MAGRLGRNQLDERWIVPDGLEIEVAVDLHTTGLVAIAPSGRHGPGLAAALTSRARHLPRVAAAGPTSYKWNYNVCKEADPWLCPPRPRRS